MNGTDLGKLLLNFLGIPNIKTFTPVPVPGQRHRYQAPFGVADDGFGLALVTCRGNTKCTAATSGLMRLKEWLSASLPLRSASSLVSLSWPGRAAHRRSKTRSHYWKAPQGSRIGHVVCPSSMASCRTVKSDYNFAAAYIVLTAAHSLWRSYRHFADSQLPIRFPKTSATDGILYINVLPSRL